MPKLKYNVKDIERTSFEDPGPGVFKAKIVEFTDEKPRGKDRRLVVKVKLLEPKKSQGFGLWSYINLEGAVGGPLVPADSVDWKLRQLIDALQLGESGTLDVDNPQKLPEVRVRTRMEAYEGEMRAKLAAFLPGSEDDDEDEDDDTEDDDTEEDEDDTEDEDEVDYSDMDDDDLVAELEERELDVPMSGRGSKKKLNREKAVELLEENDAEDEDEDNDDEDEDTDDDTEEEEDYNEWTLDDLKAEFAERGIDLPKPPRGKKAPTKAQLVKGLETDDASDPV